MISRVHLLSGLVLLTAAAVLLSSDEPPEARAAWSVEGPAPSVALESNTPEYTVAETTAAEVRWDGRLINDDEERRGALSAATRVAIGRWHEFASRRGYRIDVDEAERVILLSDAERFQRFSTSAALVDRTVRSLEAFTSPGAKPVILLRASTPQDRDTALRGARALDVDQHLCAYVEDATPSERRKADARLVEALVTQIFESEQPYLSNWMVDGIASFVAERSSGRALIDGEARTLRSVQQGVAQRASREGWTLDLFELNGGEDGGPVMEAEAIAIIGFLHRYHEAALGAIVSELGHHQPEADRPDHELETRAFARHLGLAGKGEIERALTKGRSYRP